LCRPFPSLFSLGPSPPPQTEAVTPHPSKLIAPPRFFFSHLSPFYLSQPMLAMMCSSLKFDGRQALSPFVRIDAIFVKFLPFPFRIPLTPPPPYAEKSKPRKERMPSILFYSDRGLVISSGGAYWQRFFPVVAIGQVETGILWFFTQGAFSPLWSILFPFLFGSPFPCRLPINWCSDDLFFFMMPPLTFRESNVRGCLALRFSLHFLFALFSPFLSGFLFKFQ